MSAQVFDVDPWMITTSTLPQSDARFVESITSTGNGHMGMRGNFEEGFSGTTHQGTYLAGVWFPDKTRVGWWKNGYPQYFGKVINATNIIAIGVEANGETLDLATSNISDFHLGLDMHNALLSRSFTWALADGSARLRIRFERFLSVVTAELLFQRVAVTSLTGRADVILTPGLDGDVHNADANYGEQFWTELSRGAGDISHLTTETIENPFGTPRFTVTCAFTTEAQGLSLHSSVDEPLHVGARFIGTVSSGDSVTLEKTTAVVTSRDVPESEQLAHASSLLSKASDTGFDTHLAAQTAAWKTRWDRADIEILGDDATQQGVRFNLFQLFSTYYGEDTRLNIGPKGFTGEKYGGATYWDTEAYLVPFYLALAKPEVARALLQYRFDQLDGAKHNARQQGLAGALYPMVTFTGVECHNEWEITFEEIHRNGAIAWAIYYYTLYTGDRSYLEGDGLEVLVEISRFWADRVHFSQRRGQYMIHGVTGPNEYENNVNNNWYTNYLASWVLRYTAQTLDEVSAERRARAAVPEAEAAHWRDISSNMYLPHDDVLDIAVQHDTFLDKDLTPVAQLDPSIRPLNQHWSWDRILRSPYIKQADVLQGMYFFEDDFSVDEIARNFAFYEPLTVHESSLSASIHAVLAARIGDRDKAVSFSTHTARLDLDNYNNDTEDGLHITSMSGGWLAIVQGFAGMRVFGGTLTFRPFCPPQWQQYSFTANYRGAVLKVSVTSTEARFLLVEGPAITATVNGVEYELGGETVVPLS
ncbi:MAG TPA: glycoside hydrolase family 65 protein [Pseudoclavibacter sp.]|nr:glycoside hydrolase family 65 protein [Pseudoclavibacter sp.]